MYLLVNPITYAIPAVLPEYPDSRIRVLPSSVNNTIQFDQYLYNNKILLQHQNTF
jgi:hypothetical protein